MQANQTASTSPAITGFVPTIWGLTIRALGLVALVLVITQNFDLEYSAKEVRTKFQYKGNVLIDLAKPHDK